MRCVAAMLLVAGLMGIAQPEEEEQAEEQEQTEAQESVLLEMDRQITAKLTGEPWEYASRTFVRVLWEDYKKAHLGPDDATTAQSVLGVLPEADSYDQYVGSLADRSDAAQAVLEVVKSEGGRFFVKLEGHVLPAVARNKCIVFTTGDVVKSPIPPLGDKPYCTVEMYVLIRSKEKFYLASPMAPPEQWVELSKIEKTEKKE